MHALFKPKRNPLMKTILSALILSLSLISLNFTSIANASPLHFTVTCVTQETIPSLLTFTYDDESGALVTSKTSDGLSLLFYHNTWSASAKVIRFYNDSNGTIDLFVDTGLSQIAGRGALGGAIQLSLTLESTQKHAPVGSTVEHGLLTYKLLRNGKHYSQLGEPVPALCAFNAN